ncbi:MAG TPA: ABC transporter permease [Saprospiraceae bacterium]|nr:ABC transporter permease [Saprospiraceae bacterium]HMQ84130.1 ABC transporter permease [Saprospiraceae bacterium]
MLSNYLKIAFRSLNRDRLHSSINLLGLSIGLAATLIISLWIRREWSMNLFHVNKDRIFRVLENQSYSGGIIHTFSATPGPLAPKLKEIFPEITHASRYSWGDQVLFTKEGQAFFEEGLYADPDFLEILSFPILYGNAGNALDAPGNILISEQLALKYFGQADVIGQTIRLDNSEDKKIAAVLANVPENSGIQFDFLLPMKEYIKKYEGLDVWNNNGIKTIFMTQTPVSATAISAKIKKVVQENGDQDNVELLAQALPDWHLRTDFENGKYTGKGRIETIRIFGIIALFLLAIACINFMNLATSKAIQRSREVGVRKVNGATRSSLAVQFLTESLLMTILAGILGVAFAASILPYFNQLFGLELSLTQTDYRYWLLLGSILLTTGLLAGSYPSFFLSGFKPVQVLKNTPTSEKGQSRNGRIRQVLVTTQFAIACSLIIATLIIYRQLEYMRHINLGYDREHLMYVFFSGELWDKYEIVKSELLELPGIENVSASNGAIHAWGNNTSSVSWEGKNPSEDVLFQTIPVSYDFLPTIGANLVEGRDFLPEYTTDSSAFIINETAAKLMNMEKPVGQAMTLWGEQGPIIGLVSDFHVGGLHQNQDPVILLLRPWQNYFYIRLAAQTDMTSTLPTIAAVFEKHNPSYPFDYRFCDQEYQEMHLNEIRMGELAKVFSFLAILISCLGLFGLAAFTTAQRTKEIGIRKVLGASITGIVALLSKDFLKLVLIALVIASPLAWYLMQKWLAGFSFKIEISWWIFLATGIMALLIAGLTVSFQSIKAALVNPVKSLRSE